MKAIDGLILGVDGGGTSTEAWLGHARTGEILGKGRVGPSNFKAVGELASRQAIEGSIVAAFASAGLAVQKVAVICLGLAGIDHPDDQAIWYRWARPFDWANEIILVNDGDLVVAAGTPEGWGVGVIAGTGSIAVGRTVEGRGARAGGWGHLFGDEGSAYYVVLAALRQIARRTDGRDPRSKSDDPLAEALCQLLGVGTPEALVSILYAPEFDRTRIAGLAPAILSAERRDPSVAETLLLPAGEALGEQAAAVARSLGLQSGLLPLAMAGGFLLSSKTVSSGLLDHLARRGYQVQAKGVPEPVAGALILATRAFQATIEGSPNE